MAQRWTHLVGVVMLTLVTACSSADTDKNTEPGPEPS